MERLNLCRIDLKEHDYLFDKDIENYAKFHSNFDYYTAHYFHKLITNLQNDQHFSIFHTNIQSLLCNKENLEILTQNLDFSFDVLALSET